MTDSKREKDDSGDITPLTYRVPKSRWRRFMEFKTETGRSFQDLFDDATDLYLEQRAKGKRVLTTEQRHLIDDLLDLVEHGEHKAPFMRRVVLDALAEWRRHRS